MTRYVPVLLAAALLVAGCGAKPEATSSTTSSASGSLETATPTPAPTKPPSETTTPQPSPTPTQTATPAPKGTLAVEADPTGQLKFTKTNLTVDAGQTTIDFKNSSPTPHNVAIRKGNGDPLVETAVVSSKSITDKVKLEPGTYEFYCTVPGHEEAGMKGTLTVK